MDFKRQDYDPEGFFRHPGYKRIVSVEGDMRMIFIAGQTPTDENYNVVSAGDFTAQFIHVMQKLEHLLTLAGATWQDVTYRRIYVNTMADAKMPNWANEPLPQYGDGSIRPPGTMIGVTRLGHPDMLVEMDLVAAVPIPKNS